MRLFTLQQFRVNQISCSVNQICALSAIYQKEQGLVLATRGICTQNLHTIFHLGSIINVPRNWNSLSKWNMNGDFSFTFFIMGWNWNQNKLLQLYYSHNIENFKFIARFACHMFCYESLRHYFPRAGSVVFKKW